MSPASTDNGGRSSGGDEKLVVLSSASASDTDTATGAAADAGAAAPVTAAVDQPSQGQLQSEQEPQLLVKEFPPPPNYYRLAAIEGLLTPPVIPRDAVARGTRKSRQEADRLRKVALSHGFGVETDAGGAASGNNDNNDNDDNDGDGESDNQDVTAVFGEIVEDPTMLEPFDTCPDPTKIRDEVQRLNRTVLQLFISLTKDLGGRSAGEIETSEKAKKSLEGLSHNIFLMLQETNKFREHQSREILIELLEDQLQQRLKLVHDLEHKTELTLSLLSL